jgi:hypothetical protein
MSMDDEGLELLVGSGTRGSSGGDKAQLVKYAGGKGQARYAWVRLFRQEEHVVVVATDLNACLDGAPSLSSTLALADEICRMFLIPPKQLVLIEHHECSAQEISRTKEQCADRFQWARLKWDRETKRFSDATWVDLTRRTVESILHHRLVWPSCK